MYYEGMKTRKLKKVNIELLKNLISSKGKFAIEKVVVGAEVSQTIVKSALKGKVPSIQIQAELAHYFDVDIETLFPVVRGEDRAA